MAFSSFENMIRLWHIEDDENYVITLHDVQELAGEGENVLNDKIACISFDKKSKHMIAGTKEGRILFWKRLTAAPNDSN